MRPAPEGPFSDRHAGLACAPHGEHCEARGGLAVAVPASQEDTSAAYLPLQFCDMQPGFAAYDTALQAKWSRFTLSTWLPELANFTTVNIEGEVRGETRLYDG